MKKRVFKYSFIILITACILCNFSLAAADSTAINPQSAFKLDQKSYIFARGVTTFPAAKWMRIYVSPPNRLPCPSGYTARLNISPQWMGYHASVSSVKDVTFEDVNNNRGSDYTLTWDWPQLTYWVDIHGFQYVTMKSDGTTQAWDITGNWIASCVSNSSFVNYWAY